MNKNIWFRRKKYGWGWVPNTWQGWLTTVVYLILVIMFGLTIDETSPINEVMFTFVLPAVLLTITFIRIAYLKGEKPRWQWGKEE
jgi:drug/metabolite transporter (DMT)-like permease